MFHPTAQTPVDFVLRKAKSDDIVEVHEAPRSAAAAAKATTFAELTLEGIRRLSHPDVVRFQAELLVQKQITGALQALLRGFNIRDLAPQLEHLITQKEAVLVRLNQMLMNPRFVLRMDPEAERLRRDIRIKIRLLDAQLTVLRQLSEQDATTAVEQTLPELRDRLRTEAARFQLHRNALAARRAQYERGQVFDGSAATMPLTPMPTTPDPDVVKEEAPHWSCLVRLGRACHKASTLGRIGYILVALTGVGIIIPLLIDIIVLIVSQIRAGSFYSIMTNPDTGLLVRNMIKGALSPDVIDAIVQAAGDVVERVGDKAAVQILAMLQNEEIFTAIEDLIVGLLSSEDVVRSLAGMVDSKELKKSIKKLIGKSGGATLSFLKGVVTDKQLQEFIVEFISGVVVESTKNVGDAASDTGPVKKARAMRDAVTEKFRRAVNFLPGLSMD